MHLEIHLSGIRGNKILKKMIERKANKLEVFLRQFTPEIVKLKAIVEQLNKKQIVKTKIVLALPIKTLVSEKEGYSSFESVSRAFKTLFKEVSRLKSSFSREEKFRRGSRKERPLGEEQQIPAQEEKAASASHLFRNEILSKIAEKIELFIYFAREEINILSEEYGKKVYQINPFEVVDNIIIRLLESSWKEIGDYGGIEKEIYKMIKKELNAIVENGDSEKFNISLEATYREPMISEDEIYDYFQPDNVLHFEDILYSDEAVTEETETDDEYMDFLETLTPSYRQIYHLHYIERFDMEEMEEITGKGKAELIKTIEELSGMLVANGIRDPRA